MSSREVQNLQGSLSTLEGHAFLNLALVGSRQTRSSTVHASEMGQQARFIANQRTLDQKQIKEAIQRSKSDQQSKKYRTLAEESDLEESELEESKVSSRSECDIDGDQLPPNAGNAHNYVDHDFNNDHTDNDEDPNYAPTDNDLDSWEKRKLFIRTVVTKVDKKQKIAAGTSRRHSSFTYYLKLADGTARQVCKSFFASTFGIGERTIMSWILNGHDGTNPEGGTESKKSGPKSGKCAKVTDEEREFLKQWLEYLPKMDSHYCRNTPTYQNKKILYPGHTLAELHREYAKSATNEGVRVLSSKTFSDIFHAENYSVFIPQKDRCDVCEAFKHGNISQQEYDEHTKLKNDARDEKTRDKESASGKKSVWTIDLQAVLLCPKTNASSMYYKTKLQLHNFTLYNLKSKGGFCYLWCETEGDLRSEVFAYSQYEHFDKILSDSPEIEELIVWSDGCGYQNRNVNVANMYSALAAKYGVTIYQKYLVAGHTQMECDSMHSTIERKMVTDIFTPRDYMVILQSARIRPLPYKVKQMKYSDFMKMSGSSYVSIRPGKKTGDPTVHDLRGIKFESNGAVQCKISITEDWEDLPQRIQMIKDLEWVPLFSEALPIKARKFNDLQAMKHVIPPECHHFYDTLPHQ